MTLLLWLLYPIAIQAERGGWWRVCYVLWPFALVIDVWANYTELALITLDCPKWGEWTFSLRLRRLRTLPGWRGEFGKYAARVLDSIAPSGVHV